MRTILHLTNVGASPATVFAALTSTDRLAKWWTTQVTGDASAGQLIQFTFAGEFNPEMRVVDLERPSGVSWQCVGGVEQWAENNFRFDLEDRDGATTLRFRQDYATELSDDDYATYNHNWGYYLDSLRLYCETGTGHPFSAAAPDIKQVAKRLADDIFSHGDLNSFDELISDTYVNHNIPVAGIPGTKAGFRELVQATRHAFRDLSVEVQDVIAEGDLVVFHDHVKATSVGDFFGVPPSGESLDWTEIHFLRVADGQIVEHWTNFDQLGILQQLGAVPA